MARGPVALVKAGQAPLWWLCDGETGKRSRMVHVLLRGEELEGGSTALWVVLLPPEAMWCLGQDASESLVSVSGPTAAGIWVYIHGPYYHQKPGGCLWSALPPEAMLLPKGHAELASPLTWSERVGPTLHQPTTTWWHPVMALTGVGGVYIRTITTGALQVWATARFLRSLSEDPILMVYQKPKASNQTDDSLLWTFASKAVWAKGNFNVLLSPQALYKIWVSKIHSI